MSPAASPPVSQSVERCELAPHLVSSLDRAQVLEGRNPHAIRNRFYRLQQQQQQQQQEQQQEQQEE